MFQGRLLFICLSNKLSLSSPQLHHSSLLSPSDMSLVTLCNVCNSVSIDYKAADRGRCAAQGEGGETPPLPEPGRPRPPELSSANQKTRRLASANQSPAPLYSPTPLYFILTTLWLDIFFPPGHHISADIDYELQFQTFLCLGF